MSIKQKILYISQEITPYLRETPMGLLGKTLPQKVQEKGYEARAFMPKYGCINERRNQLHEVIRLSGVNLVIDNSDHPLIIKVATLQSARMQVYFIDSDDYFQHHAVTDLEIRETPEDNDERIMFFTRGVMETVKKLRWEPAVIHNSGWVTALAPLYLKKAYADDPTIGGAPVVYSLFDDNFEGTLDPRFKEKLILDNFAEEDLKSLGDGPVDAIALNKLTIDHADGVIQASENVPQELIDYAKAIGKPFLPYQGEEVDAAPVVEFYESLRK
jgi:starch synthase